jgi:hypothetical protein
LASTLTDGILWFPDQSGWLFGYTWEKTLHTGDPHVFGLRFHTNEIICPLRLISEYISFCQLVGISLHGPGGFLFCPVRHGVVMNNPISADTINRNLQAYLQAAGLFEGETLHGFCAGGAITAALRGDSLQDIMRQANWSNSRQALHYMRIQEVLEHGHLERPPLNATPSEYRSSSTLQGFTAVFRVANTEVDGNGSSPTNEASDEKSDTSQP